MTTANVTLTTNATTHYWITPQPAISTTGATTDVSVLNIVQGWVSDGTPTPYGAPDGTFTETWPTTVTFALDDSVLWDFDISFRGAPPIRFQGLNVTGGGDLLVLLTAQGWTP